MAKNMKYFIEPEVEDYCRQQSTLPGKINEEIYAYTQEHVPYSQMMIGPLEGSFLGFLVSLTQAKRVLEIGCFTGYSALAMAERLPQSGELITLDIDEKNVAIAQSFWKKSPHGAKIKPILGPALSSMKQLSGLFELVFIDADKSNYSSYFEQALPLLSPQGVIAVDNCLWSGEVLKEGGDKDTLALKKFNQMIQERADLEKILLPLRDGVFLIRKK